MSTIEVLNDWDDLSLKLEIDKTPVEISNRIPIQNKSGYAGFLFKCNVQFNQTALRTKAQKKAIVEYDFFDGSQRFHGTGFLDFPNGAYPYRLLFTGHFPETEAREVNQ